MLQPDYLVRVTKRLKPISSCREGQALTFSIYAPKLAPGKAPYKTILAQNNRSENNDVPNPPVLLTKLQNLNTLKVDCNFYDVLC
jgi:hypothetical protein